MQAEFLADCELPRDISSQYEYSNLGAGLLGHALARGDAQVRFTLGDRAGTGGVFTQGGQTGEVQKVEERPSPG